VLQVDWKAYTQNRLGGLRKIRKQPELRNCSVMAATSEKVSEVPNRSAKSKAGAAAYDAGQIR
jgi:hypothetical protein